MSNSTHFRRKSVIGLTRSIEYLLLATYNLGTNVVLNRVKGTEAEAVIWCKQTYKKTDGWNYAEGLSECTKTALDTVCSEKFDFLALQELPEEAAERVKNYLRQRFSEKFGGVLEFYRNQDTYLVVNSSRVGQGTVLSPPLLNIVNKNRPYLGVWFPHISTFVVALHAPHMQNDKTLLQALQNLNEKMTQTFRNRFGPTELIRTCVMMGDLNADFCSEKLMLLGKCLRCANVHSTIKTCCYPEFKYRGDLIFSSSNNSSFPFRFEVETGLSSDHRLVRAVVPLGEE